MVPSKQLGFAMLVACSGASIEQQTAMREVNTLSGRPSDKFETKTVRVCWEDTSRYAMERALVEQSVGKTWGTLGLIDFVGWGQCAQDEKSVRVQIVSGRARTHAFGRKLLGVPNGVQLDFTFVGSYAAACASPDTTRLSCIHIDAVHEFGHVLGFSHEQNRKDLPATSGCTEHQLDSGLDDESTVAESTLSTMYDPDSVMNYCNPRYWNRNEPQYALYGADAWWKLSQADIDGMHAMYGSH